MEPRRRPGGKLPRSSDLPLCGAAWRRASSAYCCPQSCVLPRRSLASCGCCIGRTPTAAVVPGSMQRAPHFTARPSACIVPCSAPRPSHAAVRQREELCPLGRWRPLALQANSHGGALQPSPAARSPSQPTDSTRGRARKQAMPKRTQSDMERVQAVTESWQRASSSDTRSRLRFFASGVSTA